VVHATDCDVVMVQATLVHTAETTRLRYFLDLLLHRM